MKKGISKVIAGTAVVIAASFGATGTATAGQDPSAQSLAELKAAYTAARGGEGKSHMPFYCKPVGGKFTKRGEVSKPPLDPPWKTTPEMPGTFHVWNRPSVANRGAIWGVWWWKCVPPKRALYPWESPYLK